MKASTLIGAGVLLYALGKSSPSPETSRALSSQYAQDAMNNIQTTFGDSFAQAVEQAATTSANAAEMFDALKNIKADGTVLGTKAQYIETNPAGLVSVTEQQVNPEGTWTVNGFHTGSPLTTAERYLDVMSKEASYFLENIQQERSDVNKAQPGTYNYNAALLRLEGAKNELSAWLQTHPDAISIVPAGWESW